MQERIQFVFIDHFLPAFLAALWFTAGAMMALVAARLQMVWPARVCRWLLRRVIALFGPRPGLPRLALTIFAFNAMAIFLYMSSGVHPLPPKLIALCTGFVVTMSVFVAGEIDGFIHNRIAPPADFSPGTHVTLFCLVATMLLELPCFFLAVGMGITLGEETAALRGIYAFALQKRAAAYATVLVPILLLSAVCESIAIMGARDNG